jgi:hypothetical protein
MEPEKNDVDISKLFKWGKTFEVLNGDGKVEGVVYMKLLGDADVNRARVYALRKSAELRKELSNPDSDLRWATIQQMDVMTQEDIANYVLVFSMRDITNNALREVDIPLPKAPKSNASLAKLEKYQQEVDEYPTKRSEAVNKIIQKEVDKLKKMLMSTPKEELYKQYVQTLINEFCEREALRAYADMEVYLGCFKDAEYKERAFNSFEDFDNMDEGNKKEFKKAYDALSVGMEDLKKLREATQ